MIILKEILKKPISIIVLFSTLAFFNSWPAFVLMRKGWFLQDSMAFKVAVAISAFFIMFVIPALIIKFVFGRELSDFGLSVPENLPRAIKLSIMTLVIFLPVIFFMAGKTSFQEFYLIRRSFIGFFFLEIMAGLYFFSEEFLFRGALFFGLWDKLKLHTFWITNLIFSILHTTKPSGEWIFAFFFGLSLSYLSLKTKSFIPAAVIHIVFALVLNITVLVYSTD